jgi:hypothetical protein
MTTAAYHHPSRRETVSELLTRLKRVEAAGNSVAALATAHGTSSSMLADALRSLERDLLLALRESANARGRVARP